MKDVDFEMIYLDNAATTFPKPEIVYQSMDQFYRHYGGNAGRGANPMAHKASILVEETRSLVAKWLGASEVVFSPSATIALNMVIFGMSLVPGDVVYLTPFEHNSVLRPVEHLRKTKGIEVRQIPFERSSMACDLDQTQELFFIEPPTLVCLTQVSNVIGLIIPVEEIIKAARTANPDVVIIVDGAQAAGLLPLPMAEIDALIFSGHKSFYGPYGIAGVAFNRSWRPQPLLFGGTGTVSESLDMPANSPSRFEAGSQNIVAMAGLNAAIKWLNETGRSQVVQHTRELLKALLISISSFGNIKIYSPESIENLFGLISFNIKGIQPQSLESVLGSKQIAVRAGFHCSPWAHEFLGTDKLGGTVRASVGYFLKPNFSQTLESTWRERLSSS